MWLACSPPPTPTPHGGRRALRSSRRHDALVRARATRTRLIVRFAFCATAAAVLALFPSVCAAQVTPAGGYTPPDDTPAIRIGTTIFANYGYQKVPDAVDADGNTYKPNSFDVARAYINVTGNISHIIGFRVTP